MRGYLYLALARKEFARYGTRLDYIVDSAERDDFSAVHARALADIHYKVGGTHRVLVVLDDYKRVAEVSKVFERIYELGIVALVQSYTRLVEDIQHARQSRTYLRREPYTLRLAARKTDSTARQSEVIEPHVDKEVEPRAYFFEYALGYHRFGFRQCKLGKELAEPSYGQCAKLVYVLSAYLYGERFFFQAFSAAVRTGLRVGESAYLPPHAVASSFREPTFHVRDHALVNYALAPVIMPRRVLDDYRLVLRIQNDIAHFLIELLERRF